MINPEEFKKLSLEYAEQIKYYNREIYKVKEQLRYLRTIRKTWETKAKSLVYHELNKDVKPS